MQRLTTHEVAERLGCKDHEALAILKAANTPHTRMGRRGAILWDAEAVGSLIASLPVTDAGKGGAA